ncbi:Hsp20/alpha crystallin family protein [Flavobacterium jejuense]|uniref:Hsp20/alpha crystallin family protein n=1 Tax=Flavobacterium jejuense TaxID=1544455 RepID=A0ABX0IS72_9FLAO|nr:Hsp20/alpha crystallin family protein [Flavobacterium jejuense]NHN24729.1 Hsp20/alpha crystallin family protein [Flavobacterium jejuense]
MNLVKSNPKFFFPSVMEELFKPDFMGGVQGFSNSTVPAVNIKETETEFKIELASPGLKREDFKIEVDENVLSISSERKNELEEQSENGKYTRKEFSFSSFKRSFTLPETVNEDDIKASYENGVLYLSLPKREEALPKPKRFIEIG